MTQHAHHAARYSAVVALAGALLAPGVTTPATALEDPGQTPDATPAQAGNNVQAQDPAVKVPGEGNERMPQGKVEQPAAKANDTATVAGSTIIKNGQGLKISGSGWGANAVIAVKYDGGDIKLDRAVNYNGKDYASRGVVAIIQADADGKFTYTLPFPNSDKWGVGTVHDITFLTGSLQKGDEQHSVTLSGINYAARQGSITKQASLGAAAELENDTLINRVQARAKAAAKNGSNSGAHAKSAPKKTHTAKAAPGKNGTQGNATAAATQSDSNSAPNIIGAELSGFSRWFANNANNVLLSIAGLIILVLALTFRKRA